VPPAIAANYVSFLMSEFGPVFPMAMVSVLAHMSMSSTSLRTLINAREILGWHGKSAHLSQIGLEMLSLYFQKKDIDKTVVQ